MTPALPLEFLDVSVGYDGVPVLSGVNGKVPPGSALALVGPNGSGKTTLLKALAGAVDVLGGEIRGIPETIGYVPQSADLDPEFPITAEQVVEMGLYRRIGWGRRPNPAHRRRIADAIARVGLLERSRTRFGELSGGQKQRILLARALVADPGLLLLDEPFNGLDQPNRDALLDILRGAARLGTSIVVSTHDLVLAREACDLAMVLSGVQVAFGTVDDALAPAHLALAFGYEAGADARIGESA
ncbi:metal ABC transporter ATP-binding protein [Actinomyces culturomici]|uniref:metal ABC transporter ATP-binding protein n=1 Tax=Actinomyces culturomici TaxID=1926276 RepID=UPI000E2052FF|nr:ABC transporter ATP-binding protein [Actinomyces culturomici]